MLRDRGFRSRDNEPFYEGMSLDQFIQFIFGRGEIEGTLSAFYDHPTEESIHVVYVPTSSKAKTTTSVEYTRSVIGSLEQEKTTHAILIMELPPSSSSREEIEKMKGHLQIEIFLYRELQYNVTEHYLVSKHQLLTNEEKTELEKEIKISDLPIISSRDPVARYYGSRPGQIFRISRQSVIPDTLVTESLVFRRVVDKPIIKK